MTWILLLSTPAAGAENMAIDELLLAHAAHSGESVLRVYGWAQPTLSFGRNQKALGTYDPERPRERGIATVRRPTGGRALLHHREVTYSVAAPIAGRSLRLVYLEINRILCDGLRRLGVDAQVSAGSGRSPSPGPAPCFDAPVAGELTVDGRKLVGSAQWRGELAYLQHGSILVADDQSLLPALASIPLPVVPPPSTLTELLGRTPALTEVADALFASVREREPDTVQREEAELRLEGLEMVAKRYRDESWTWRR